MFDAARYRLVDALEPRGGDGFAQGDLAGGVGLDAEHARDGRAAAARGSAHEAGIDRHPGPGAGADLEHRPADGWRVGFCRDMAGVHAALEERDDTTFTAGAHLGAGPAPCRTWCQHFRDRADWLNHDVSKGQLCFRAPSWPVAPGLSPRGEPMNRECHVQKRPNQAALMADQEASERKSPARRKESIVGGR